MCVNRNDDLHTERSYQLVLCDTNASLSRYNRFFFNLLFAGAVCIGGSRAAQALIESESPK